MADEVGLRVEGARELRASLRRAGSELGNEITEAHKDVADLVSTESKAAAPRRSGKLAGSGRGSGTKTMAVVRFGGARVRYAGPQHFGWAAHNIPARPWVTDTAQRLEPRWTERYETAVEHVLNTIQGA
jgi:phage gpG-like protein